MKDKTEFWVIFVNEKQYIDKKLIHKKKGYLTKRDGSLFYITDLSDIFDALNDTDFGEEIGTRGPALVQTDDVALSAEWDSYDGGACMIPHNKGSYTLKTISAHKRDRIIRKLSKHGK